MPRVTLVLLPGLDGTGIMFEPFLRQLPPEWTPIVVRYPGDQSLSYDDLRPIARSALPDDGPFILLGESFSGPLAIRLAAEHPRGMCGLVLCATFASTPAPLMPRWSRRLIQPRLVSPLRSAGRLSARVIGFHTRELRELFARAQSHVSSAVLADRVRLTLGVDVATELQQIEVPMLYLSAKSDHIVSRSCLRQIQSLRPDVEAVVLDSPHWILQARPRLAVEALQSFLKRCLKCLPDT